MIGRRQTAKEQAGLAARLLALPSIEQQVELNALQIGSFWFFAFTRPER